MSWQRILETARKQGIPVIVTDVAGREPMVILPFAEYERMGDSAKNQETGIKRQEIRNVEAEAFADFGAQELQKQVDAAMAEFEPSSAKDGELALEERFYLEPVEDEGK